MDIKHGYQPKEFVSLTLSGASFMMSIIGLTLALEALEALEAMG